MAETRVLGTGYLLHEVLGRGSTGEVWRGTRRSDESPVAVKVLRAELARDTDSVTRFLRERSILRALDHPRVITVHDLVVEGDTVAIVMDLVEGPDLRRYLSAAGVLDEAEATYLLAQVASGLSAAHELDIVHRDLKPENVLLDLPVDSLPSARITDFGIARFAEAPELLRLTGFVGTPAYIAPEIARGGNATSASDLYALGSVLYELVAGHTPFVGDNPFALLRRHVEDEPTRPNRMSDSVWELVSALLAKDPTDRPPSAGDAARALGDICRELGGAVPDSAAPEAAVPARKQAEGKGAGDSGTIDRTTIVKSRDEAAAGWQVDRLDESGTVGASNDHPEGPHRTAGAVPPGASSARTRRTAAIALVAALAVAGVGTWWFSPGGNGHTRSAAHPPVSARSETTATAVRGATVTTYALAGLVPGNYGPEDAVVSPGGTVWFAENGPTGTGVIGSLDPSTRNVTQTPVPSAAGGLGGLAIGPGGTVWFTEPQAKRIGEVTSGGKVRTFAVPVPHSTAGAGLPAAVPVGITSGPDGALWFTEATGYFAAAQRALSLSRNGGGAPGALISGGPTGSPDGGSTGSAGGGLGATSLGGSTGSPGGGSTGSAGFGAIGRIDPVTARVRTYALSSSLGAPTAITSAAGRIWFTTPAVLGSLDPATGVVATTSLPGAWLLSKDPESLAAGPSGSLWFPYRNPDSPNAVLVARADESSGAVTTVTTDILGSEMISDIAVDTNGNAWFTTLGGNSIGRIAPAGTVTAFRVPFSVSGSAPLPLAVAADPSRPSVWFTELGANRIASLTPAN